jgi:hypothetical protein
MGEGCLGGMVGGIGGSSVWCAGGNGGKEIRVVRLGDKRAWRTQWAHTVEVHRINA